MAKIQSITAYQRLRQLASRQLGQGWSTMQAAANSQEGPAPQTGPATHSSQIHQQLAARAGVVASTQPQALTLAERAQRRQQMNLERQQFNLERIMELALEYCNDQTVQQDVDPDWFHQYCQQVQDISSAPMQNYGHVFWPKRSVSPADSPAVLCKFYVKCMSKMRRHCKPPAV